MARKPQPVYSLPSQALVLAHAHGGRAGGGRGGDREAGKGEGLICKNCPAEITFKMSTRRPSAL